MHHLAFHQERRRDDIANSDSTDSTEEILRFLPASERSTEIEGEIALRLVFQVAEVIRGTEDRANAIEKRAQSLVESAVDELKHAGDLLQKLETERHAIKARMSEEIRETMDRANAIEKRAADELKRAKNRIQELETERQVAEARMSEVSATMQETEKALKCAVSQLAAAEDQVVQAELRARKAEMRASEMTIALRSIEEALRTRPLGQRPAPSSKLSAAA